MDPSAVGDATGELTRTGDDLTTEWTAAAAAISGAVGQLGKGVLGQAFLHGYQSHADEIAAAATAYTAAPSDLATTGNRSVDTYIATDENTTRGITHRMR
jgi:hypothetical protein